TSSRWASQSRALRTLGYHGVLAVGDVREKLVGEPQAGDLRGDLRTLVFDEGDPVPAVADAEFLDFSERQPRALTDLDHSGLADRLVVVGPVSRREPVRPEQADVLPMPQHVGGDLQRGRRVADALGFSGHIRPFTSGRPEVLAWHTCPEM